VSRSSRSEPLSGIDRLVTLATVLGGSTAQMKSRSGRAKSRFVQVDPCPDDGGYVLSVGPMSVWVSVRTAKEIVSSLGEALAVRGEASAPGRGRRSKEREEEELWQKAVRPLRAN
jgi:hypothetical protein